MEKQEYLDAILDKLDALGTTDILKQLPIEVASKYVASMAVTGLRLGASPEVAARKITIGLITTIFQVLVNFAEKHKIEQRTDVDALRDNAPNN